MINCDGICMVLGVQWWIAYIIVGIAVATIGTIMLNDGGDPVAAGFVWLGALVLWPVLLVATFFIGLAATIGGAIIYIQDRI